MCEKGTEGWVGRERGKAVKKPGKEREGRERGNGTPCVSLNYP